MSDSFDLERLGLLQNRVLIRPDQPDAFTHGGLVIPPTHRKPSQFGTVVALGQGMRCKDGTRWPMPEGIGRGSRVVFDTREHWPIVHINGEDLISLRDDCVLAEIIEE